MITNTGRRHHEINYKTEIQILKTTQEDDVREKEKENL